MSLFVYFMFVCASFCCVNVDSSNLITPCHAADTACLKRSAQAAVPVLAAGIPSLGVSAMDPMTLGRVEASQRGLQMDFRNTVVKGLRNCVVDSLKLKGLQIFLNLKCSVNLVGDYTLGGQLLVLPIRGNGKYRIKIRDIMVNMVFQIEEKVISGQKYWGISSWKHTSEVLTGARYQFDNLFEGNKALSDSIHAFSNSNWKEIFQEVAPPVVKAIVDTIVKEIQKLFNGVPVSELEL